MLMDLKEMKVLYVKLMTKNSQPEKSTAQTIKLFVPPFHIFILLRNFNYSSDEDSEILHRPSFFSIYIRCSSETEMALDDANMGLRGKGPPT